MLLKRLSLAFVSVATAALMITNPAPVLAAGDNTWTDAGDALNWSDAANWSNGAVQSGDSLYFDATSIPHDGSTINDLTNPEVSGLHFIGDSPFMIGTEGNLIRVSNDITSSNTGGGFVGNDILATGKLSISVAQDSQLFFLKTLNIQNFNAWISSNDAGMVVIDGTVRGTTGRVYVTGVVGPSLYGTYVTDTGKILSATVVKDGGLLQGDGTVSTLTVAGSGSLATTSCLRTGNLTLDGNLFVDLVGKTACSGYGQIKTAGKVDVSGAKLLINPASYKPKKGAKFTIVSNNGNDKVVGRFSGLPEGAKFKIGSYSYKITYKGGSAANDIVLTRQ